MMEGACVPVFVSDKIGDDTRRLGVVGRYSVY